MGQILRFVLPLVGVVLAGCSTAEGMRVAIIDMQSEGHPAYETVEWEPIASVHVFPPKAIGAWARVERPGEAGGKWRLRWSNSSEPYEQGGPSPQSALLRLTGLHESPSEQRLSVRIKLEKTADSGPMWLEFPVKRGGEMSLQLHDDGRISLRE